MNQPPELIVTCPKCGEYVLIEKINCAIFRHGILRSNNQQIPSHADKIYVEHLLLVGDVIGCGKPFKIENGVAVICDWI